MTRPRFFCTDATHIYIYICTYTHNFQLEPYIPRFLLSPHQLDLISALPCFLLLYMALAPFPSPHLLHPQNPQETQQSGPTLTPISTSQKTPHEPRVTPCTHPHSQVNREVTKSTRDMSEPRNGTAHIPPAPSEQGRCAKGASTKCEAPRSEGPGISRSPFARCSWCSCVLVCGDCPLLWGAIAKTQNPLKNSRGTLPSLSRYFSSKPPRNPRKTAGWWNRMEKESIPR